jgi:hypothetical protein
MGARAGGIFTALLLVLGGPIAAPALGSGWAGSDPSSNFAIGPLPSACQTSPTGAVCIGAAVNYLDQARASLGQPPYDLPADFAALNSAQQALILTNSDRTLYGLPPITGLTDALDQDAAAGVLSDSDPQPSTSDWYGYTSNASWGDVNMVVAYEGWMYDDGPGSDNVDCTSSDPSGCWGHRHDILWQFGPGALAMGAAAGTDSSGGPSYTMLLLQGSPGYAPVYNYTWAQAMADGTGSQGVTGASGPSAPSASPAPTPSPAARDARVTIRIVSLRVRGHRITVRLAGATGSLLHCSLSRGHGRFHWSKRCSRVLVFSHVPAGRYRLRIRSGAGSLIRRVRVP